MNKLALSTLIWMLLPSLGALCVFYSLSTHKWIRVIISLFVLLLGILTLFATLQFDEAIKHIGQQGMSPFVRDTFLFVCSIFSGALGINMLTNALDYSTVEREALRFIGEKIQFRKRRIREAHEERQYALLAKTKEEKT